MKQDTEAQIKQCLSCKKARCINCHSLKDAGEKMGRPSRPVCATNGNEVQHFASTREAARWAGKSAPSIRKAIAAGGEAIRLCVEV